MFTLDQLEERDDKYWVPITVWMPTKDGRQEISFDLLMEDRDLDSFGEFDGDRDAFMRLTHDCRGVRQKSDEGNKELTFEEFLPFFGEQLKKMWFLSGVRESYFARMQGGKMERRRGN